MLDLAWAWWTTRQIRPYWFIVYHPSILLPNPLFIVSLSLACPFPLSSSILYFLIFLFRYLLLLFLLIIRLVSMLSLPNCIFYSLPVSLLWFLCVNLFNPIALFFIFHSFTLLPCALSVSLCLSLSLRRRSSFHLIPSYFHPPLQISLSVSWCVSLFSSVCSCVYLKVSLRSMPRYFSLGRSTSLVAYFAQYGHAVLRRWKWNN